MASSAGRDFAGGYMTTGDSTTYNYTTQDFTVLAWVRSDSNAVHKGVCGNTVDGSTGWALFTTVGGDSKIQLVKQGSEIVASSLTISTGAWFGVAIVQEAGVGITAYKLTSAGVFSSATAAGTINPKSSSANFEIGSQGSATHVYDGVISHVQVFNRMLTASEVHNALTSPGKVLNGLTGYWPLHDQGSTTDPDLSSNDNALTETGTVNSSTRSAPLAVLHAGVL